MQIHNINFGSGKMWLMGFTFLIDWTMIHQENNHFIPLTDQQQPQNKGRIRFQEYKKQKRASVMKLNSSFFDPNTPHDSLFSWSCCIVTSHPMKARESDLLLWRSVFNPGLHGPDKEQNVTSAINRATTSSWKERNKNRSWLFSYKSCFFLSLVVLYKALLYYT